MTTASDWPVELRGVLETVVATEEPAGTWNIAALGVHAPTATEPPWARTWGRTRTRRNFTQRGHGVIQFVDDPVAFVEAALSVWEQSDAVVKDASGWVAVETRRFDSGTEAGTDYVDWRLEATESSVINRTVPTYNRGEAAVIEASVHASRLGIRAGDDHDRRRRLDELAEVIQTCGGERAVTALERLITLSEYDGP